MPDMPLMSARSILCDFTDPSIRLQVLPRNLGISGAMNATILRARGRYFAILNFDDRALPGRLRRQVGFLEANPDVCLVFGLPQPVDDYGAPAEAYSDFSQPLRLSDFSRRTWLRQFFFTGNCLCAPTAMIRREAYVAAAPTIVGSAICRVPRQCVRRGAISPPLQTFADGRVTSLQRPT
jgi:glycosyltransferase involved in cell wall biosynthesis